MAPTKTLELKGKPGNWIVLSGKDSKIVAEAKTLQKAAKEAERLKVQKPAFARIPRSNCSLIL